MCACVRGGEPGLVVPKSSRRRGKGFVDEGFRTLKAREKPQLLAGEEREQGAVGSDLLSGEP